MNLTLKPHESLILAKTPSKPYYGISRTVQYFITRLYEYSI